MPSDTKDTQVGGVLVPIGSKPWSDKRRYQLQRDKTTIGRAADCKVKVNHPAVSRVHAELTWVNATPMIAHLSTVNPTLVNGVPVKEPRALRSGDLIEIADGIVFRLEIFAGGEADATQIRRIDTRRMFAVVHTDVAEYSRLVEDDDAMTARQLETCLEIMRSETESANGDIVQVAGDGIMLFFTSTKSAVTAAIGWQRRIASLNATLQPARKMVFRVGINAGDILITAAGGTHGDAINIAARIQALAPPGGILVTGVVRDQLQAHDDLTFEYLQTTDLKNLSHEVSIYRVKL